MRHPQCLFSPARALRRVFLSDLDGCSSGSNPSIWLGFTPRWPPSANFQHPRSLFSSTAKTRMSRREPTHSTPAPSFIPARKLTTTRTLNQHAFKKRNNNNNNNQQQAKKYDGRKRTNEGIPFGWVRIVDPTTNALGEPQRTSTVLSRLDLKVDVLVMVAPPPPPDPDSRTAGIPAAICRVVNKQQAAETERAVARAQRRLKTSSKELELNWAIAGHDLLHKLRRLRQFLERGMKVEIMLARKKHGRRASREEGEALLAKIRELAFAQAGAKEVKQMEGEVGGVVRLFFEGPTPKKAKAKEEDGEEDGEDDDE